METLQSLNNFFLRRTGLFLLFGHFVFAARASTLWLSRGENTPPPEIGEIVGLAWIWPVSMATIFLLLSLVGLAKALRYIGYSWEYRSLIDSHVSKFLDQALPYAISIPLLLGVIVAWSLNLDIFGGVFESILTIVEIAAGVAPLVVQGRR